MDEGHLTREEKHIDHMVENEEYRAAYYEAVSDVDREIEERLLGIRPLCQ